MDSCVGPHRAHQIITTTPNYDPSAVSPITCILVPADTLAVQYGQLRRSIRAQNQIDDVLREELLPALRGREWR